MEGKRDEVDLRFLSFFLLRLVRSLARPTPEKAGQGENAKGGWKQSTPSSEAVGGRGYGVETRHKKRQNRRVSSRFRSDVGRLETLTAFLAMLTGPNVCYGSDDFWEKGAQGEASTEGWSPDAEAMLGGGKGATLPEDVKGRVQRGPQGGAGTVPSSNSRQDRRERGRREACGSVLPWMEGIGMDDQTREVVSSSVGACIRLRLEDGLFMGAAGQKSAEQR